MKVSKSFLLLTAIFLFFSINNVSASTIWADGVTDTNGGWFDANKTYVEDTDTLLCWAASAANILSWSGWNYGYADEDLILDFFADESEDTRGWMDYAWNFWFDGTESTLGNFTYFDGSGHPGFYRDETYADLYVEYMDGGADVMWDIADLLDNDYGVTVAVRGNMSHAITVWGVDISGDLDEFSIWITDSDDDNLRLDNDELYRHDLVLGDDDRWYIQDYYGSNLNYIKEIQALKKRPDLTTIPRLIPSLITDWSERLKITDLVYRDILPTPTPFANIIDFSEITDFTFTNDQRISVLNSDFPEAVPEPATVLLFGMGLLGLAGVSRKKIK